MTWLHQAITWTNVDWSSLKSSDINVRAISQEMPQPSITKICLKITYLKFHSNFPGTNELTHYPQAMPYGVTELGKNGPGKWLSIVSQEAIQDSLGYNELIMQILISMTDSLWP